LLSKSPHAINRASKTASETRHQAIAVKSAYFVHHCLLLSARSEEVNSHATRGMSFCSS